LIDHFDATIIIVATKIFLCHKQMSGQVVNLLTELGPVISSASFITFLSALQVNGYMTQVVDAVSSEVVKLIPGFFNVRLPGSRIVKSLFSMLLAIAIIGLVYVYIIMPIYAEATNGNNDNKE